MTAWITRTRSSPSANGSSPRRHGFRRFGDGLGPKRAVDRRARVRVDGGDRRAARDRRGDTTGPRARRPRRARRHRRLPGSRRPRAPAPDRGRAARGPVPWRHERGAERDEGRRRPLLPELRAERGRHRAQALVRRAARARVRPPGHRDALDARRAVDVGRNGDDDALRELRRPLLRDQPVRRRPRAAHEDRLGALRGLDRGGWGRVLVLPLRKDALGAASLRRPERRRIHPRHDLAAHVLAAAGARAQARARHRDDRRDLGLDSAHAVPRRPGRARGGGALARCHRAPAREAAARRSSGRGADPRSRLPREAEPDRDGAASEGESGGRERVQPARGVQRSGAALGRAPAARSRPRATSSTTSSRRPTARRARSDSSSSTTPTSTSRPSSGRWRWCSSSPTWASSSGS